MNCLTVQSSAATVWLDNVCNCLIMQDLEKVSSAQE